MCTRYFAKRALSKHKKEHMLQIIARLNQRREEGKIV